MTVIRNAENLRQYKSRFSLIAKQMLAFASSANMVREVRKVSLNSDELHEDF